MSPLTAIIFAAKKVGVNVAVLLSICSVETGLKNIHNYNDGHSHSFGVCQVKVSTAQWLGRTTQYTQLKDYSSKDLSQIDKNAFAAAIYLKYQYDRYGSYRKAVSAYNAGRAIDGNKGYVDKVYTDINKRKGSVSECDTICLKEILWKPRLNYFSC